MRLRHAFALLALLLASCGSTPGNPDDVTLFIVRHAEAWSNVSNAPTGSENRESLTPKGRAQARELAEKIYEAGGADIVLTSATIRTVQTAEAIAQRCGAIVIVTDALRKLDGGSPAVAWSERVQAWDNGTDPKLNGGESMGDGVFRAMDVINRYSMQRTVVVSHGDITAAVIGELSGTPIPQRFATHELQNGEAQGVRMTPVDPIE